MLTPSVASYLSMETSIRSMLATNLERFGNRDVIGICAVFIAEGAVSVDEPFLGGTEVIKVLDAEVFHLPPIKRLLFLLGCYTWVRRLTPRVRPNATVEKKSLKSCTNFIPVIS
jgi:hypothetical protein